MDRPDKNQTMGKTFKTLESKKIVLTDAGKGAKKSTLEGQCRIVSEKVFGREGESESTEKEQTFRALSNQEVNSLKEVVKKTAQSFIKKHVGGGFEFLKKEYWDNIQDKCQEILLKDYKKESWYQAAKELENLMNGNEAESHARDLYENLKIKNLLLLEPVSEEKNSQSNLEQSEQNLSLKEAIRQETKAKVSFFIEKSTPIVERMLEQLSSDKRQEILKHIKGVVGNTFTEDDWRWVNTLDTGTVHFIGQVKPMWYFNRSNWAQGHENNALRAYLHMQIAYTNDVYTGIKERSLKKSGFKFDIIETEVIESEFKDETLKIEFKAKVLEIEFKAKALEIEFKAKVLESEFKAKALKAKELENEFEVCRDNTPKELSNPDIIRIAEGTIKRAKKIYKKCQNYVKDFQYIVTDQFSVDDIEKKYYELRYFRYEGFDDPARIYSSEETKEILECVNEYRQRTGAFAGFICQRMDSGHELVPELSNFINRVEGKPQQRNKAGESLLAFLNERAEKQAQESSVEDEHGQWKENYKRVIQELSDEQRQVLKEERNQLLDGALIMKSEKKRRIAESQTESKIIARSEEGIAKYEASLEGLSSKDKEALEAYEKFVVELSKGISEVNIVKEVEKVAEKLVILLGKSPADSKVCKQAVHDVLESLGKELHKAFGKELRSTKNSNNEEQKIALNDKTTEKTLRFYVQPFDTTSETSTTGYMENL